MKLSQFGKFNLPNYHKIILFVVFIEIIQLILITGCGEIIDMGLDEKRQGIVTTILIVNRTKAGFIDLPNVVGIDIVRICIQMPYMSQETFEKAVGRRVNGYNNQWLDDRVTWWLFDTNGISRKIEILNAAVMSDRQPEKSIGICFDAKNHQIEFVLEGRFSQYQFRRQ